MTQRPNGQRPPGREPSRSRPGSPRRPGEKPDDKKKSSKIVVVGGSIALVLGAILVIMIAINSLSGIRHHVKTPTQPASGKIFIDKKGVEGLSLVFWPVNDDKKTPRPHAVSGPGGAFQLSTYGENDGAPPGEYKVTVQWFEAIPPRKDEPEEVTSRDKLFGRYSDPDRKGLVKVQIKPGVEEIEPINLP